MRPMLRVHKPLIASSLMLSLLLSATLALPQPALAKTLPNMPGAFYPDLIADVAEVVAPSVVNVTVEAKSQAQVQIQQFGGPLGDEIFRRFFGFDPQQGLMPFQKTIKGNGSGMIISKDGYILTNNHVIDKMEKITITLNDGRQFPARLIGRDAMSDMAVLKIDAPNLTPVTFGNSDKLRPGEWVVAVGSPLGFDHTVTQGIVSALSRKVPDLNPDLQFIQTDAAINPGNSGGPLVNLKGEVVGINTAIAGQGQNIGFAIPINNVRQIADTLMAGKPVTRPWLGISMVELNPELAKHVGLPPATEGVVVAQVMQDSPAYKAGLMQGDVIQKVDGRPVEKAEAVQELVRTKPVNSRFTLDILRNGHPVAVALTSEQLPQNPESMAPYQPRVMPPNSVPQFPAPDQ